VSGTKISPTSLVPVFFTNYVHSQGLNQSRGESSPRLIYRCPVWQVAAVSASTPPLFSPQKIGMHIHFIYRILNIYQMKALSLFISFNNMFSSYC
jgi:hypothetical protein